jgi:hypothetical protein
MEGEMVRIAALVVLLMSVWASPASAWSWPVEGPVVRGFVLGSDPYAGGQHRGIDIGAAVGVRVAAPVGGVVSFVGSVPNGGRAVTIRTEDGYAVTLLQLGDTTVARGGAVSEGEAVGAVGESADGVTRVPHVHLGVRVASDEDGYLDPLTFLPRRDDPPAPEPAPAAVGVAATPASPPAPAAPAPAEAPQRDAAPAPAAASAPAATAPIPAVAVMPTPSTPPVDTPTDADEPLEVVAAADTTRGRAAGLAIATGSASSLGVRGSETDASPTSTDGRRSLVSVRVAALIAPERRSTVVPRPAPGLAATEPTLPTVSARDVPTVTTPAGAASAADTEGSRSRRPLLVLVALLAALSAAAACARTLRMMNRDAAAREDPDRSGVAVCVGTEAHRPRGGVRRAVGRVRPLPAVAPQRRPHGGRHGRARNAGDGHGRSRRRVAA